jgi:hypothetical protein
MEVVPERVRLKKGGGPVRVYSNPLVEENRELVKGRIECRGS